MTTFAEALARVLPVDGWMGEADLRWLWDRAQEARRIVEVGVWRGRSTLMLALATPGVVLAVDHFQGSADPEDGTWDEVKRLGPGAVRAAFRAATDGLGNVVLLEGESTAVARHFAPGSADLVFIDATHTYDAVLADLRAWRSAVRPGGILAGHDASYESVALACAEALGPVRRVPDADIWWVRR